MKEMNSALPKISKAEKSSTKKVPWDELKYIDQEPYLDKARWLIDNQYLMDANLNDVASKIYLGTDSTYK